MITRASDSRSRRVIVRPPHVPARISSEPEACVELGVIGSDPLTPLAPAGRTAIMGAMSVQEAVDKISREVESLTGCPIFVGRDLSIKKMASVELARGPLRLHRISIHPSHGDVA